MLTRLKVNGFKNLVDIDLSFGPFTCIAGVNGVGKSNLFDAITFLAALAEKPLLDAALSVRGEGGRSGDLRSLFHRVGDRTAEEVTFEAEMLIPETGADDLGQEAKAATTFLTYALTLGRTANGLCIRHEALTHITQGDAWRHLPFPHSRPWRKSVVTGRRASPFISTDAAGTRIYLHQDQGQGYRGGGGKRTHVAEKLPRTVLSNVNAAENATAVLARREMQSWRLLQLEPSALRAEDDFLDLTASHSLDPKGRHLPATLARLARRTAKPPSRPEDPVGEGDPAIYAQVANRLAELIEGVRSIRVDVDERRELLTLMLQELDGTEHAARSLSDGTLRFLALAILERASSARGVLCMEEPENGIHPQRIPAMLRLLRDLAVDPTHPVDEDNPLRQVIVNTHSPVVVAQVLDEDLLFVIPQKDLAEGRPITRPVFHWLPRTWRAKQAPGTPPVALGRLMTYLNPVETASSPKVKGAPRRVIDREDFQLSLSFGAEA